MEGTRDTIECVYKFQEKEYKLENIGGRFFTFNVQADVTSYQTTRSVKMLHREEAPRAVCSQTEHVNIHYPSFVKK